MELDEQPNNMLICPCVGRVEVAFDGTLLFRGWQTCPGPTAVVELTVLVTFNLPKRTSETKGILVDTTSKLPIYQ